MRVQLQKTVFPKISDVKQRWFLVDANDQILGRMTSQIVSRLLGKNHPKFTPGFLLGESIIIINASKIKLTGKKMEQKEYIRHSGYFGGLKRKPMQKMSYQDIVLEALKGMLPKNKYGRKLLTRVRVFENEDHNMQAQIQTGTQKIMPTNTSGDNNNESI